MRITAAVLSIAGLFSAGLAQASCEPFPLRNQTLPELKKARFDSRNGEFSLALPFKKQRVEFGSYGHKCFYAINIDSLVSSGHASVEWVYLDDPQSKDEFLAYWHDFIADYLARNFGQGHYDLVKFEEYTTPDGRPAFRYAGTGVNNTGEAGAIHGVAIQFGKRMANAYFITQDPIAEPDTGMSGPAAEAARTLADSLACESSDCVAR